MKKEVRREESKLHTGFEDKFEPVEALDLSKIKSFSDLTKAMSKTSFQGRTLGEGTAVLYDMVTDKDCFVVMTLAGAMTVAKMGLVITEMIDKGLVNAIISTGALMAHGFIEAAGLTHFKYQQEMNDRELYLKGYDRVYDTLELEKNLDDSELIVREILRAQDHSKPTCSYKLNWELGKYLIENTKGRGILKSAYEKKIPIYTPAFTDSEFGIDFAIHNRRMKAHGKPLLQFDPFLDLYHFTETINLQKTIGIFTIGGGVPRNWAQQVGPYLDILEKRSGIKGGGFKRYKYGVRICPEPAHWGGLCLHGDTKIEIPRNLKEYPKGIPIKHLVGKSNIPVYSFDRNKKRISLSNIKRVLKTGRKKLYKINFGWVSGWSQKGRKLNTDYIIASGDHKFLLWDGTYKKVSELKQNDRLMPFNTYYKEDKHGNYRFISLNNGKKIAEHQFLIQPVLGRPFAINEVVHHKDHNTLNNDINNLTVMDNKEHVSHHRSVETLETRQKRAKTLSQISDPKQMRERSMKFWDNISKEKYEALCSQRKEIGLQPKERIRRSVVAKNYWNKLSKEEKKIRLKNAHITTKERWFNTPTPSEIRSAFVSNEKNPKFIKGISEEMVKDALVKENGSIKNAARRLGISIKVFNKRREIYGIDRGWISQNCIENHFVLSIEYFGEDETYDITVDDTHNFVANGIVVSNSGCTYIEGVSWGKFMPKSEGGKFAEVLVDATVAWPLMVKSVLERLEKNNITLKKNFKYHTED